MADKKVATASIQQIIELTRRVADQRRRVNEQVATLQAARESVREQGAFIPKTTELKEIRICF